MTPPHCATCRCLDEIRKAQLVERTCPICQGKWLAAFNEKSPCLCVETRDAQSS